MQIYLARNNQQAGPYTLEEVNQMLASQQVLLTDLAWHQGMTEWKALGELTQGKLVYEPINSTPAIPTFENQTSNNQVKSNNNISLNKAKHSELAPFYARFIAKFIDLLLWLPASYLLTAFFSDSEKIQFINLNQQFLNLIINKSSDVTLLQNIQTDIFNMIPQVAITSTIVYLVVMLAIQAFLIGKFGQSLGKIITRIKIVDYETDEKVNVIRGFILRSVVFLLPSIYFMPLFSIIDYLFTFGKKKQTLHDRLAKTKVIKQ